MKKYITLVVGCINSKVDKISSDKRYQQTLESIQSYKRIPNNKIFMFDSSVDLEEYKIEEIKKHVDYFEVIKDDISQQFTIRGLKSLGETYQILYGLHYIKNLNLNDVYWVFKLGGRDILMDSFNVEEYNNYADKIVFRQSSDSYISGLRMIETTMWSFAYSRIDNVLNLVDSVFKYLMNGGVNTEHGYYELLDKSMLVEKEIMHMRREYAPNNQVCEV